MAVGACLLLFALDYYVYRNWRLFARHRSRLRWTLPIYRVLMVVMPATLPVYFVLFHWWEVEPKLPRAAFFGFWAVYYLPKLLVAFVLLLKDFARFVIWLFGWFQEQLQPAEPAPEPALDLTDMKRITRGAFLRQIGWTAASVPFVLVGYSVFRTLYDFQVHRAVIRLPNLPRQLDGLTIGQVSDLHAGSFFSDRPMWEAVEVVQGLKPDLIVVTGDYVNHDAREAPLILPALQTLKADLGVYGSLGNHDHYADVRDVVGYVKTTPIDLLVNEHRTMTIDGAKLHLIGADNTGFGQRFADLPKATEGIRQAEPGDDFRVLLAHDPSFWDDEVRPHFSEIDLMLSGHTHGGQIGFEFGPLHWGLASFMYKRWAGLYTEPRAGVAGPQYLYVNRGVGTVGPPLRIGIRPEITLLTLRKG